MKLLKDFFEEARSDKELRLEIANKTMIGCARGLSIIKEGKDFLDELNAAQHVPCLYIPFVGGTDKLILHFSPPNSGDIGTS